MTPKTAFPVMPIAVMAFAIVAFLVLLDTSMQPNGSATQNAPKHDNSNLVACTDDAKLCPDGSAVGRIGPKCEFAPCPVTNTNSTNTNTASPAATRVEVIYFADQKNVDGTNESWTTFGLFRKVDNGQAESYGRFGGEGLNLISTKTSLNHKYFAINFYSKVFLIDLDGHTSRSVYTAKRAIAGVAFSADSSKLFIWDQQDGTDDKSYEAHEITTANGHDTLIGTGTTEFAVNPVAWRKDGLVVMMHSYYPNGKVLTYNPSHNSLAGDIKLDAFSGITSPVGSYFGTIADSISDVCNEYSGSAFSAYGIHDTKTGDLVTTIGDGVHATGLITFSSDEQEILYTETPNVAKYEDCAKRGQPTYYRQKVTGGSPVVVTDAFALLQAWVAPYVPIETVVDPKTGTPTATKINSVAWGFPSDASILDKFFALK